MTYVIVGASSGLGRALAEHFATAGYDLVIVSSDTRDLNALASDLTIRSGVRVFPVEADLGGEGDYPALIYDAAGKLGDIQGLLFPVGANSTEDDVNISTAAAIRLAKTNFLSVVAIIGKFMPMLHRGSRVAIVGFGSVSASRGRNANVLYAAAKRALASYFESLRHAAAESGVFVQFYVLGYLETNLSFGIPTLLPKASVKKLANRVLDGLNKDFGVAYYPGYWRFVCMMVRLLPWFVFKHLKF
jgi:short-subunit dehydrogenase